MNISELLALANKISARIANARKERNFSQLEISAYLAKEWGMKEDSAHNYIRSLESGSILSSLDRPGTVYFRIHQRRISDYLSALGIGSDEAREILLSINRIQPRFGYSESDIASYLRNSDKK